MALEQALEEHLCQENKQTTNTGKNYVADSSTHVIRERLPELRFYRSHSWLPWLLTSATRTAESSSVASKPTLGIFLMS